MFQDGVIDALCPGEGDLVWPDFLDAFARQGAAVDVAGFCYRRGGDIVDRGDPPMVTCLDELPFADYSDCDFSRYDLPNRVAIASSRGCILRRAYCIHLTPFPAGYMMGVWVALEDVRAGSGELFYHPGSHRSPRLYAHHAGHAGWPGPWGQAAKPVPGRPEFHRLAVAAHAGFERLAAGYPRVDYRPRAGDVLFWHENLIHGGAPRRDPALSRKSVAMHYFADGCIAYYDSWGDPAYMAPA